MCVVRVKSFKEMWLYRCRMRTYLSGISPSLSSLVAPSHQSADTRSYSVSVSPLLNDNSRLVRARKSYSATASFISKSGEKNTGNSHYLCAQHKDCGKIVSRKLSKVEIIRTCFTRSIWKPVWIDRLHSLRQTFHFYYTCSSIRFTLTTTQINAVISW